MGGITSGVGLFSGIDSRSIIDQLLAIEARPRNQASARVVQLQLQQAAFLDINSRMLALKSASGTFRTNNLFKSKAVTSSNAEILSATAERTAAPGTYQFVVDRLVSTQQLLSRGFSDTTNSSVGATAFTFETAQARLDRDVALSDLNDGQGIERGRITITDSAGTAATVDLSRATTVGDVLEAINQNGTARVQASVSGGRLVLKDIAGGGGQLRVGDLNSSTTAASLGIAGTATGTLTGQSVYRLGNNTTLSSLGDGRGVAIRNVAGTGASNFSISVGGTAVQVNIGDVYEDRPNAAGTLVLTKVRGAASTVGQVLERMNAALDAAGFADVDAAVDGENGRLTITDTQGSRQIVVTEGNDSTARDLGLAGGASSASFVGKRVLAGLNTTLVGGLNGGRGVQGDGNIDFTLRDGSTFAATVDPNQSLNEVMRSIESQSGGRIKLELDRRGTGLTLTDLTGGSGNLIIEGTGGADTAASLGLSTGATGVAAATFSSGNLQRQYVSRATLLSSLNNGKGIGTGEILIRDAQGNTSAKITIGSEIKTVGDLIQHLNTRGVAIEARINAKGDGIEIVEAAGPTGANKIKITDSVGTVAKALGIAGEATGTGTANKLDGSAERTVNFLATDTLQQVIDKINQAGVGVSASAIRDGGGATPFRVNLTSSSTGTNGRFLVDTGSLDMGWRSLDAGNDARLFFGSADPARGVAVTSSTNQLDGIIPGLRIDAKSVSSTPVSLTVKSDNEAVISAVKVFVETFNIAIGRVDFQSKYDAASERGGPLLGDSTALELRSGLFRLVQSPMQGATGQYNRLTQIGIKVVGGGKIELDESKLRDALQTDFQSVESLFTARDVAEDTTTTLTPGVTIRNPNAGTTFTRLGIMGQFEQLAERYTTTVNGVLTNRNRGLDSQIKLQRDRVVSFTDRLTQRRGIMERQFQAMESAIQKLQTQSSSLGNISRVG